MINSTFEHSNIKDNSKTFYLSSLFLPKEKKDVIRNLYMILRYTDDQFDQTYTQNQTQSLKKLLDLQNNTQIKNFYKQNKIDYSLYEKLLEGMKLDIVKNRYQNYEEVYDYCYKVAGVVGIMICQLYEVYDETLIKQAEKLGVAMQITNILRDVKEDAKRNRIYFGLQDMKKFNVTQDQIIINNFDKNLQDLMKYYTKKAHKLYEEGENGINNLPLYARPSTIFASELYRGILSEIEKINYNPFIKRVYVKNYRKIFIMFKSLKVLL